jgi:hypothetical protein
MRGKKGKGGSGLTQEAAQQREQQQLVDGGGAMALESRMGDVWQQFEQEWDTEKRGHRNARHQVQQQDQQQRGHRQPQGALPELQQGSLVYKVRQLQVHFSSLLKTKAGLLLAPVLVGGFGAAMMLAHMLASRPGASTAKPAGQQAAMVAGQAQQKQQKPSSRLTPQAKEQTELEVQQQERLLNHVFQQQQEWLTGVYGHNHQADQQQQQREGAKEQKQQQAAPTSTATARDQGRQAVQQSASSPQGTAVAATSPSHTATSPVLDVAVATDLLQQWHKARAQAFGRQRQMEGLQAVLLGPALEEYEQQVAKLEGQDR